jgi:anti-sigma B factor antagonist
MRITERRVGDVTVLAVSGRLTLTDAPGRVKETVKRLVGEGQKQIVLNMAEVTYVDSSGLGELVAAYLSATRGGGTVKLANAGHRTQDLLVLTKLLTVFESHDSESAAIESFAGAHV